MIESRANESRGLSQSLYEELEALKIRIAFAEISETEIDDIEKELSALSDPGYSEEAQKRAMREIQRRLDRKSRKRFAQRTVPQALHILSIVMLLLFFGLTTATATIRPVRLKVLSFISRIEEHHTTMSLDANINVRPEAPAGWQGAYYPGYIPDMFELAEVDSLFNSVRYATVNDRKLEFNEFGPEDYTRINVKEGEVIDIKIHDASGFASVEEDRVSLAWGKGETYFTLFFNGELEEAERIAESVQPIH